MHQRSTATPARRIRLSTRKRSTRFFRHRLQNGSIRCLGSGVRKRKKGVPGRSECTHEVFWQLFGKFNRRDMRKTAHNAFNQQLRCRMRQVGQAQNYLISSLDNARPYTRHKHKGKRSSTTTGFFVRGWDEHPPPQPKSHMGGRGGSRNYPTTKLVVVFSSPEGTAQHQIKRVIRNPPKGILAPHIAHMMSNCHSADDTSRATVSSSERPAHFSFRVPSCRPAPTSTSCRGCRFAPVPSS